MYAILIAATMSEIAIPAVPFPRYGEVPLSSTNSTAMPCEIKAFAKCVLVRRAPFPILTRISG